MNHSFASNHFLALRPDSATRDRLSLVSERLRAWELPANWTHPDDYHLTVLYLGDLTSEAASWIPAAIGDVAESLRRPTLQLAGLGASGTRGETVPRSVYAAASDHGGFCADLRHDLGDCLEEATTAPYVPHLTLCRPHAANPRNAPTLTRDWPRLLTAHGEADWGACVVDALVLYRSTTRTPRYEEVSSWSLA